MKLILAIISTDDTKACISALNRASYHVTRLATTGGFLSSGNTTLIIGCEDKEVEKAIEGFIEWFDKNCRLGLGKTYLIADKANKELLIW